jgi:hypothetical protein
MNKYLESEINNLKYNFDNAQNELFENLIYVIKRMNCSLC